MDLYQHKILIVDDNAELAGMIRHVLQRAGYQRVFTAGSVREGMRLFQTECPDMAILDIMLPDGDGFSLFRQIRELSPVPILFLSAKDEDKDRLFGLGLGADDYITKPFVSQELVLRVGAVLKRTYQPLGGAVQREEVLRLGERVISFDNASVQFQGGEISLTAKELALLQKLSQNRGKVVTFDALCYAVWGDPYYGYENTLMVHKIGRAHV